MNNAQHAREWQTSTRMMDRKPRGRISDSRRRQEEDTDDQPMMPVRSSAVVEMEDDNMVPSPTELFPTRSNLDRNGVAVGQPLNNNHNATKNDYRRRAMDENEDQELLKRVLHLEEDLKKSYQSMFEPDDDRNTYRSSRPIHLVRNDGRCEYQVQQETYHQLPASPPQVRRSHVARIPTFDANLKAPPPVDDTIQNSRGSAAIRNNNRRQRPHTITVPQRGIRRCLSAVTMSSDLFSFDGSEFEAIPPADDYMDDDQLQEYLDQLAKEEDRKNRERESLKKEFFSASAAANTHHSTTREERESLRQLLQQLDCGGGANGATRSSDNEDYEAYLDRLMEEQMQVEEQYKQSNVARRVSDISL